MAKIEAQPSARIPSTRRESGQDIPDRQRMMNVERRIAVRANTKAERAKNKTIKARKTRFAVETASIRTLFMHAIVETSFETVECGGASAG